MHEGLILVLSNAMSYTLSLLEVSARTSTFEQEKALGLDAPSDGHDYHYAALRAVKSKTKSLMHDMLQSAIAFAYLLGEKGFEKFELLTQVLLGTTEAVSSGPTFSSAITNSFATELHSRRHVQVLNATAAVECQREKDTRNRFKSLHSRGGHHLSSSTCAVDSRVQFLPRLVPVPLA